MKPKVIAFYLPQYHPVKENNEWFGEGFTEWTLVAKSKPLYKGHVQPKIPANLGFYDLRIPEVRAAQAELAKEAGIAAFCYYHYWFGNGKQLLERPLNEVVNLGEPDFPFCLCWANHSWFKKQWNPQSSSLDQTLLMKQEYPGDEDIENHFNSLLHVFKDKRYYKIDGKLVFVVYNVVDMPNYDRLRNRWNEMAKKNGLPDFYFITYTKVVNDLKKEPYSDSDANILALISNVQFKQHYNKMLMAFNVLKEKLSRWLKRPLLLYSYSEAEKYFLDEACKEENVFPVIVSNWDYTPRRGVGGLILKNATPELFKRHALRAFDMIRHKPEGKQVVFLKSWNEWGEGNYIEPDQQYGKGYIEALREAIEIVKEK